MMTLLLCVLLSAFDDDAQAGAAYRAAEEAARQGQHEEAVARLQEALRSQPRESDRLKYRDRDGLHLEPYFPHFLWAQTRAAQARSEKDRSRQRLLIREAMTHLELTHHASAPELLKTLKEELAAIEKSAGASDEVRAAVAALGQKIKALCEKEDFEEAGRVVAGEKALLDPHPAERAQLLELVESRRSAVLGRYEKTLDLALDTVAVAPPIDKPDSIPQLLLPGLPPRMVGAAPDARSVWLQEFLSTVQDHLSELRSLKETDGPKVLSSARAFEESAARALKSGTFSGFRAAASIAVAVRWSRIQALSGGKDDAQLDRLLADSEEAALALEKSLGRTKEYDAYRAGVLVPHLLRVREEREKFRRRTGLTSDVARWVGRADQVLAQRSAMANPDSLRAVARELGPLEDVAAWKETPAPLRARALFACALLEAVSVLLEGDPAPGALERPAAGIKAARSLDARIDELWKDRLSPKLKTWLERLDR
jgi:hypothetical protein